VPVKKSKPRTATSQRRIKKYEETYRSKTVPLWFKKTLPHGASLLEEWLTNQEELEKQIYAELQADGIPTEEWIWYAALGRRCFIKCLNFSSQTYAKERTSLRSEFILRGLDAHEVDEVISIADYKCGLVKGILVTLQDIEDKLDNGTWGLVALKALIDAIEAKLDDPTSGLANLKTLIDDLEDKLDNGTYGLAALKALIDALEAKLDDGTSGLDALKALLDAIEDKLDDGTYGLAALKALLDAVESKLDNPTYGLNALYTNLNDLIFIVNADYTTLANWVDEIETLLKNATYGLSALHTDIAAIESKLDNATYGLDALHTHLTSIENTLLRNISCMTFLSTINAQIQLPAAAADTNLPDVVISGIPAGATLDKVLVFLIVRAIQNTNAGGANAIEGAQNIRVKKSTGAWGVDDVVAIPLTDNMWTVAASTREFGDVIGGDDANDVKSEVDGNATYNLRFEDANVDLDFLQLNDVQVLIKVWYH